MTQGHNSTAPRGHWRFKAFRGAGEAVCWFDDGSGKSCEESATPTDPAKLRERSIRRSRITLRRYVAENRLTVLWGLTWARTTEADCEVAESTLSLDGFCPCGRPVTRAAALSVVPAFIRRLRADVFRGQPFPYVVVPEAHKDGHWHAHLALARFVPWQKMVVVWGHGSAGVTGSRTRTRASTPGLTLDQARSAAAYLAKYLAKGFDEDGDDLDGTQRYRVGEGFQPTPVEGELGLSTDDEAWGRVLRAVNQVMGGRFRLDRMWDSADWDEWEGPHTAVLRFTEAG